MGNVLALKNCLSRSRPHITPLFTLSFTKHSAYLHCRICHRAGGSSLWCNANCRYPRQTLTPTALSSSCSYLLIRTPPKKPTLRPRPLTPPLLLRLRLSPPVTYAGFQRSLSRRCHTCCWVPVIPCSIGRGQDGANHWHCRKNQSAGYYTNNCWPMCFVQTVHPLEIGTSSSCKCHVMAYDICFIT